MRIAYIWYNPNECSTVEQQFREQQPTWQLICIPEERACSLNAVLTLLRSRYDAVLVHLSFRYCLALKMAELIHRENIPTKVILFSRTLSDRAAISGFFDGHIHPDRDIFGLTSRIEAIVGTSQVLITDEQEIDNVSCAYSTPRKHLRLLTWRSSKNVISTTLRLKITKRPSMSPRNHLGGSMSHNRPMSSSVIPKSTNAWRRNWVTAERSERDLLHGRKRFGWWGQMATGDSACSYWGHRSSPRAYAELYW